ncbi:hypothetical protein LO762_11320 [Actinocorallia sp. API 0066]|uniref:hypothetical protein n=1 Tax=Actinocorallia sp. API 0066 TaxID=2896846 RepID=UPI001E40FAA0|nr:hypothetical protein [Actinocorallia sp. API 0066]MCD0449774.1 hypothetical protein [Actinocorallia sp. API 0066]
MGPTSAPHGTPCLRIGGAVRAPRALAMAELRALPQHACDVVFSCRRAGARHHRFAGPLLLDVVGEADPVFAGGDRKARLRFLLSLRADDGHRAVLSWGEIDPEFGAVPVLVALSRDGRPLDVEGPTLAVPGDRCGARSLTALRELTLRPDA